jgi:ABC-type Zn uptake system ZnuABC Zn-binding protein ZnuA
VLNLAEHVQLEGDDPHWWQDPRNAIRAVAALRDALTRVDRAGAGAYERAAAAYTARLERLDRAVAACIEKVPVADRTLVTTHDALGYYARRYGIRVVGAVIPSRSTVAQPSAGEIAALVDTIRREHVKAVFAESSVRPDVEEAIARESGARIGRALWADTLGPRGSGGATYIDSIASNTAALVDGFTEGETACRPRP